MSLKTPLLPTLGRRRLAMALPLLACGVWVPPVRAAAGVHRVSRQLMGTRVDITLQGADPVHLAHSADAALAEMSRLAAAMTRFQPTSELNAINLMAGVAPVPVSAELMAVLTMAQHVHQASDGAFDATVGSLSDWRFDANPIHLPTAARVQAQLKLVGQDRALVLDAHQGTAYLRSRGTRLDLGGIAKLPILQAGMALLQRQGVHNAMLNGGGDVLVNGHLQGRPWRVGVRDPRQPDRLLGTVHLTQGWVAASGDYERFVVHQGQRFHHILDPRSGHPTRGTHGVALVSTDLAAVNGMGTAIMVSGVSAAQALVARTPGLHALVANADGSLWVSSGMAQHLS